MPIIRPPRSGDIYLTLRRLSPDHNCLLDKDKIVMFIGECREGRQYILTSDRVIRTYYCNERYIQLHTIKHPNGLKRLVTKR
jgi:hypothetical protein